MHSHPLPEIKASYPRVAKFGGTSVQDAAAILQVCRIISAAPQSLVVVLSAMAGITDLLLTIAHSAARGGDTTALTETFRQRHLDAVQSLIPDASPRAALSQEITNSTADLVAIAQSLTVLREVTPKILDRTISRGERLLAQIVRARLDHKGIPATYVDATEIIRVEPSFGMLFPDLERSTPLIKSRLLPELAAGRVPIIPGFIGQGPDGDLVTLGRGGSDLSASVIGHGLQAKLVTLYKEVEGLMTADPRHVPEARIVPELHYREATELAYYGAKVLHPRTMIPLLKYQIPLVVRSTFRPEEPGTRIAGDVPAGAFPVKAITAVLGQSLVSIEGGGMMGVPGVAARTFGALSRAQISVSMISQASSEASICFVVTDGEARVARKTLEEAFRYEIEHHFIEKIAIEGGQAVLAVVGLGMSGTPGMASRVFAALARADVNVEAIAQGSSELNISVVIPESKVKEGVLALHREFRLEKLRTLPIQSDDHVRYAVWGFGQIGRALVRQLMDQKTYLKDKMGLTITCLGLADRSGFLMEEGGVSGSRLGELLSAKERGTKLGGSPLGERLWRLSVKKGIFVDTTADETTPLIKEALAAGWHVALANKKPLAASQSLFDDLFETARESGTFLRYEATVGAGLPILDTLAKLEGAGDEVYTILGCLSGTLGYLMTALSDGTPFSTAVRTAHSLGYTEPDPRDDLSGMDVGRKALILARTLGLRLNLSDIRVESLFDPAMDQGDPTTFLDKIKELDPAWKDRVASAQRRGQVLRYVARIARNGVRVGIEEVDSDSPLGRLRGTDNQVSITTKRYHEQPLILSGPGAGAEVTAAGVFNDLLAIATSQSPERPTTSRRR